MKARSWVVMIMSLGVLGAHGAGPAQAAEEKAACPAEVSQARAMVARAQEVLKGGSAGGGQLARAPGGDAASGGAGISPAPQPGTGTGGGRTQQGDPASGTGSGGPEGRPSAGGTRGLATSSTSEISPWNPSPTDKTLNARTAKAQKLTAQARRLCRAGKPDEARTKAREAIAVLDPK